MTMSCLEACTAIAKDRGDDLIVSTMTAMFAISKVSPSPLNISSVPLMGGASCIGLGLALGCPDRRVVILDGDASLLMELGSLATIAGQAPKRYLHFVFNNNRQFSGTGNIDRPAGEKMDFAAAARAAGYAKAVKIDKLMDLENQLPNLRTESGPVFVELDISAGSPRGIDTPQPDIPDLQFQRMGNEARALQELLG